MMDLLFQVCVLEKETGSCMFGSLGCLSALASTTLTKYLFGTPAGVHSPTPKILPMIMIVAGGDCCCHDFHYNSALASNL